MPAVYQLVLTRPRSFDRRLSALEDRLAQRSAQYLTVSSAVKTANARAAIRGTPGADRFDWFIVNTGIGDDGGEDESDFRKVVAEIVARDGRPL